MFKVMTLASNRCKNNDQIKLNILSKTNTLLQRGEYPCFVNIGGMPGAPASRGARKVGEKKSEKKKVRKERRKKKGESKKYGDHGPVYIVNMP